jgi:hypothetical protein
MGRKAQGLPMNLIVIAAIALAVMVVLIVLFWGKARSFGTSTASCTEKRGECMEISRCDGSIVGQMDCPDDQICCISFGTGEEENG